MRNTIILVLICLLLGTMAYYSGSKRKSTLGLKETQFSLSKPDIITEIHIGSAKGKIVLVKSGNLWTINGEQANNEKVLYLLNFASKIEAVAPAPISKTDVLNDELQQGINIRFFQNRKKIAAYTLASSGNYMYARRYKAKKIYRVDIKGYPEIDFIRFLDPVIMLWKNNTAIDIKPENIDTIKLFYPNHPLDGFYLKRLRNDSILLTDVSGNIAMNQVGSELLFEYLHYFRNINHIQQPGIAMPNPADLSPDDIFFDLTIFSRNEKTLNIKGYRKRDTDSGKSDRNVFYGMLPENNLILLNYNDFDPILVPAKYFLKK